MCGNRVLDGNHVHADAVAARRDQMGLACQRQVGHLIKAVGKFRILLDLLQHHVGHLCDAGHKELDVVLFFVLRVLPVILHRTGLGGLFQKLLHMFGVLAGDFGDDIQGLGLAQAHLEHDLRLLITLQGAVQKDIFRILLRQSFDAEFIRQTVSDHFAEIKQDLSCHTVASPFRLIISDRLINYNNPFAIYYTILPGKSHSKLFRAGSW